VKPNLYYHTNLDFQFSVDAMSDGGKGLRVLLVRHAQSQNNIVQAGVQAKIKAGVSPQQAQGEWLSARQDDPDLSPEGYDQLKYLRMLSTRLPANTRCKTFKIYTSPMRRACATAKCVEEGLGDCRTFCIPELVEGVCVLCVCNMYVSMYTHTHAHARARAHTHTHLAHAHTHAHTQLGECITHFRTRKATGRKAPAKH